MTTVGGMSGPHRVAMVRTVGRRLKPGRHAVIDLAAAALLSLVATLGFRACFGGWTSALPSVAGVAAALLLAHIASAYHWSAAATVGGATAAFFLVGTPACLSGETLAGLPTPSALVGMVDGAVNGWAQLLTVVPPAGREGNLLVVPFLVGFVGALGAGLAARRTSLPTLPVLVPLAGLLVSVLWGTSQPVAATVQGAGFLLLATAWAAHRLTRRRHVQAELSGLRRLAAAGSLLACAAGIAPAAAKVLPLRPDERFVLRDVAEPPLDPSAFASPLTLFPRFHADPVADQTLLTLSIDPPPPDDVTLRIGAMDSYDGMVFAVDGTGSASSGVFVKTGPSLPEAPAGTTTTVRLEFDQLGGNWIPVVGEPTKINVLGASGRVLDLRTDLRFNRTTRSLLQPKGVLRGDTYQLETVLNSATAEQLEVRTVDASLGATTLPDGTPDWVRTLARSLADSSGATDDASRVEAIAEALRTDGVIDFESPGTHSLYRLSIFMDKYRKNRGADLRGTPEQYAASMALLVRALGLPARVVVGFQVPSGSTSLTLTGRDVRAWVEVPFPGAGWLAFDPVPEQTEKPATRSQTKPQRAETLSPEPPPPSAPAAPTTLPADEDATRTTTPPKPPPSATGVPWGTVAVGVGAVSSPIWGVLALGGLVVLLKSTRSKRRRRHGAPAKRATAAWMELLDLARDHQRPVPLDATRVEAARLIGVPAAEAAAVELDEVAFGGVPPSPELAERMWSYVDEVRRDLNSVGRSPLEQWRIRIDASTLLTRRPRS